MVVEQMMHCFLYQRVAGVTSLPNELVRTPTPPPHRFFSQRSPSQTSVNSDAAYRSAMNRPRSERSAFFPRRLYSHYYDHPHHPDTAHGGNSFFSGLSLRKYKGGGGVNNDPKVLMAREKIATAAEAEKEADRALMHARARMFDAMEHQGAGARGQGGGPARKGETDRGEGPSALASAPPPNPPKPKRFSLHTPGSFLYIAQGLSVGTRTGGRAHGGVSQHADKNTIKRGTEEGKAGPHAIWRP
ncbi:hypothetical protein C8R44DRAFT_979495 [Mycena epipterygia]|nr:hypothetical protein C8R44DRAFT_979495 [Mycena epipterygia]